MAATERKIPGTFAPVPGGYSQQIGANTALFIPDFSVSRYDPSTGEVYGYAPDYDALEAAKTPAVQATAPGEYSYCYEMQQAPTGCDYAADLAYYGQPPAAQRHAGPVVKRPVPITQNTKQEVHKMQYYEINEQTARRANDVNSMSDYHPGSATEEYRSAVDKAAALVQARKATGLVQALMISVVNDYHRRERCRRKPVSVLVLKVQPPTQKADFRFPVYVVMEIGRVCSCRYQQNHRCSGLCLLIGFAYPRPKRPAIRRVAKHAAPPIFHGAVKPSVSGV